MAGVWNAEPRTYLSLVSRLRPGDTLLLAAGVYRDGLPLHGLHGHPDGWITIRGPATGPPARFVARAGVHTVTFRNASYLVLDSLAIDGVGIPVDGVKAEDPPGVAHHITLTNLTIVNHGAHQQNVGISTKCPAWNWTVRGNRIIGAGTGMYFGNSEGNAPFVAGIIEENIIADTIGYNVQVKHQGPRPALPGMPSGQSITVLRRNIFSKGPRSAAGEMARPNLLVGHFPLAGIGASDEYQIHGNLFLDNPGEALLQAEGNVAVHDNVFVNRQGNAITIRPHNHRPRHVLVFRNAVIARKTGISMRGGESGYVQRIEGNIIFAREPLAGGDPARNIGRPFDAAREWLTRGDGARRLLDVALRPEGVRLAARDA